MGAVSGRESGRGNRKGVPERLGPTGRRRSAPRARQREDLLGLRAQRLRVAGGHAEEASQPLDLVRRRDPPPDRPVEDQLLVQAALEGEPTPAADSDPIHLAAQPIAEHLTHRPNPAVERSVLIMTDSEDAYCRPAP